MMKLNKQTKKVCVLAVVLALLIALMWFLLTDRKVSDAQNGQKTKEDPMIETGVVVFETLEENIAGFEYIHADGTYNLILKDGAWIVKEDPQFPVEPYVAGGVAYSLQKFIAKEIVEENAKDISKYGLEEPFVKTIVHFTDGTTVEFRIGSKVQGSDSYYVKIGDSNNVYEVEGLRCASLMYKKEDLISRVMQEVSVDDIQSVDFANANGEYFRVEHDAENLYEPWHLTKPFAWKVNEELVTDKLLRFLVFVEAEEYVTDKTEAEMGLTNPSATVTVTTYDGKVHKYYVGKVAESNSTAYIKVDGVRYPALADSSIIQLTNLTKFDIIDKYIATADYDNIKTAVVTGETNINLNYTGLKLNGKTISEETAIKLYSDMCELEVDSEGTSVSGSPALTMQFTFENNEVRTYKIYRQDAYFYAITMDGKTFFKIKQRDFVNWIDLLNQYL
ncbi:MAG: DUF4340 domain-containing protein [Clostridia bacterium]|nr:DUF4340 domain-containing protein [Clostridia bacterium]